MWIDFFFQYTFLWTIYLLWKWVFHLITGRSQLERILLKQIGRKTPRHPTTIILIGTKSHLFKRSFL
jgi:hypothetical protein